MYNRLLYLYAKPVFIHKYNSVEIYIFIYNIGSLCEFFIKIMESVVTVDPCFHDTKTEKFIPKDSIIVHDL